MFTSSFPEDALLVTRLDPEDAFGSMIVRPFELEGMQWVTAEHYYQAMKYPDQARFQAIVAAPDAATARKLGVGCLKRKRRDWQSVRQVVMTRALYTQARTHEDFATRLLDTSDQPIFNKQQYDYYWGLGRDHRGNNHYGEVLMRVRQKLREEQGS